MKWFSWVAVAMLVWGNSAFAQLQDANPPLRHQLQTIWYRMALLNFSQPDLHVRPARPPMQNPEAMLGDLEVLEGVLAEPLSSYPLTSDLGEPTVGSLKYLACANPVCDGGGDGGKCHACKAGN